MPSEPILVIGDVMADVYLRGTASRLSPEAPVPVVDIIDEVVQLGGAGNVARNVHSLGCPVALCGAVGLDFRGHEIDRLLINSGISAFLFAYDFAITTTKNRIIANQQQVLRYDEEAYCEPTENDVIEVVERAKQYKMIILSDYGKGFITEQMARWVIEETDAKVLVDPKDGDWSKYRGAYCIKPNRYEFEHYAKGLSPRDLLFKHDWQCLLLTKGEEGMELHCRGEKSPKQIPAISRPVFDVSGAGDTAIAALAAYLPIYGIAKAAEIANTAASVVAGKPGTACVTREEIESVLSGCNPA